VSADEDGVVVYRTTRITMINAVRDAHPAPVGRLRRQKRLTHAELADAILLNLAPEAEPASLKVAESAERIIAARDAEIAGLKDDHYALIRANNAEIESLRLDIAARTEAYGRLREADSAKREAVDRLLGQRERADKAEAELARVAAWPR
jgi:hypothetical protein